MTADENSREYILLFNKESKVLLGTIENVNFDEKTIGPNVQIKRVRMNTDQYWYGNYDTGRVFDNQEKPFISEISLRDKLLAEIMLEYPINLQMSILQEQLDEIIPEEKQTERFKEMRNYIERLKAIYHLEKEAYSCDPETYNWGSDDELKKTMLDRHVGMSPNRMNTHEEDYHKHLEYTKDL